MCVIHVAMFACLHARIQDFFIGGPSPTARKQLFFSPQLILQLTEGVQRKLYFSKDPEGVQKFPEGPTLSRGSKC